MTLTRSARPSHSGIHRRAAPPARGFLLCTDSRSLYLSGNEWSVLPSHRFENPSRMEANELTLGHWRPAGQKVRCLRSQATKESCDHRSQANHGWCVRSYRYHPQQNAARGDFVPQRFQQRTFYGRGYVLKDRIAMSDLIFRAQAVMAREIEVIKAQLRLELRHHSVGNRQICGSAHH